jgi:hypothetical protein
LKKPSAFGGERVNALGVRVRLCSVSDRATALREVARVLRPGGELRICEHVISNRPTMARIQRALDATIYPLGLSGGCHCARDTHAAILEAGFTIDCEERIAFKPSLITPPIPDIPGAAGIVDRRRRRHLREGRSASAGSIPVAKSSWWRTRCGHRRE